MPVIESVVRRLRALLVAVATGICAAGLPAAPSAPPNIIFILADDLGWGDVAFHGGKVPTPHLDRLAKNGVELTQHYSAMSCSPTRTALLSGRYWSRFGVLAPTNARVFAAETVTLPKALQQRGYQTALVGKWHLGSKPQWSPNHFGFDYSYGSLAGGVGPYDHLYKKGEDSVTWHRNGALIEEEGHVTDLIVREAVTWIGQPRAAPFFLYAAFTAVHLPLKEPEAWLQKVPASITEPVARHYAASILHLDDAVGQIVAAVGRLPKDRPTIVVFTSDNGATNVENNDRQYPDGDYPSGRIPGSNGPLRGIKTQLYEGGIRVPTVIHAPGLLPARTVAEPVHIVDWMPTFCALAGYDGSALDFDGRDLWPQLTGKAHAPATRTLYWASPRGKAIRVGHWKLIVTPAAQGRPATDELFDLGTDPNETKNLAAAQPERVTELKRQLAAVAKADRPALPKE